MATHRRHPDPSRNEDPHILYNDCERCTQHAASPITGLDDHNLHALWTEMLRVESAPAFSTSYRNTTEARACHQLYAIRRAAQRLAQIGIDPTR